MATAKETAEGIDEYTNYIKQNVGNIGSAQKANTYNPWGWLTGTNVDKMREEAIAEYNNTKQREYNANEAEKARNFNAEQAQLARNFEQEMSNTAYQRASADMKEAGINILNATNQQASTPTGASASGSGASFTPTTARATTENTGGQMILGLIKAAIGITTNSMKTTSKGVKTMIKSLK